MVSVERTDRETTVICADGQGTGIGANIAARMCITRLQELLRLGFSLRQAFERVVYTINQIRGVRKTYVAFSLLRILRNGSATVLSYEAPCPVLISRRRAVALKQQIRMIGPAPVGESNCIIQNDEALVLCTDGITQAGLGNGYPSGWGDKGFCRGLNHALDDGLELTSLTERVHREALRISGPRRDDVTAVLVHGRDGLAINVLTGPPGNPEKDAEVVAEFLSRQGMKVACGGTTADIIARYKRTPVRIKNESFSSLTPPKYEIEGLELVTEGAVTLNQAYNILDEDPAACEPDSPVAALCVLLQMADYVNFTVGLRENPASRDISFRQQGILSRRQIVPLIAEHLKKDGKLVVVNYV